MNLLFIPHVPNLNLINRVYEFAKNSDSYFLSWQIDNSSFKHKITSQLSSLRYKQKGKIVQIPLIFKPESIAPKINTFFLNKLIKRLQIDVVVNANALLFDIKAIEVPVIYDLVDDHLEVNEEIGLNQKRIDKIKEDIKHSKGVVCVTEFVEQKAKKIHQNTITIENGVYLERFKKARSLKKELGLEGKRVFGYIGGVDSWTGLQKAIENYIKIKNGSNAFIVVGGSDGKYYQNLVQKYKNEIIFIGKVQPEKVPNYFKTLDIGLIPFELNDFTNNALPIKALEYALAGASVIATPLKYLEYKSYPFVKLCPIEDFYTCMEKTKKEFDFDFTMLDWKTKSQELQKFIGKSL